MLGLGLGLAGGARRPNPHPSPSPNPNPSPTPTLALTLSAQAGSTLDWTHVVSQIGMFAFTGLSAEEVDTLARDFAIFLTRDGRVSMAGVNSKNVEYVAQSFHAVTKVRAA